MRILKLHHPTGHPYWKAGEYQIELPNGERINPANHIQDNYGGYRVFWDDQGVWVQACASGSGYGKVDRKNIPPKLMVRRFEYDKIEFVGSKLEMPDTLKQDLAENYTPTCGKNKLKSDDGECQIAASANVIKEN